MALSTRRVSLLAIVTGFFALAANAAFAQTSPVILIVNQSAIMSSSDAGRDILRQINDLTTTVNGEIEAEVQDLTKAAEDLQAQRELISEEAFLERARTLAERERRFPGFREMKVREIQLSRQQAMGVIGRELQPILEALVNERGATLLLDRSAVMYASADSDITAEVMDRLNSKLKEVPVERIDLQKLAAEQRAAQQAAAEQ